MMMPGLAYVLRRVLPVLVLTALAGCSSDPMRFIPENERMMLQAEARMNESRGQGGAAGSGGNKLSVQSMLDQQRGATPQQNRLVLRFASDVVQPDAAQRAEISQIAERGASAGGVTVLARPLGAGSSGAMLDQRRAVAVSRLIEPSVPGVAVKFDSSVPADSLIVIVGTEVAVGSSGGGADRQETLPWRPASRAPP
jgi:hypothetical protein